MVVSIHSKELRRTTFQTGNLLVFLLSAASGTNSTVFYRFFFHVLLGLTVTEKVLSPSPVYGQRFDLFHFFKAVRLRLNEKME